MSITVKVYQDARKKSVSGLYPVLLNIYVPAHGKQYRADVFLDYEKKTKLRLTVDDFNKAWQSKRITLPVAHAAINESVAKAQLVIANLHPYNHTLFLAEYSGKIKNRQDIITLVNDLIEKAKKDEGKKIKTLVNYKTTVNSLVKYKQYMDGAEPVQILFSEINADFLRSYTSYLMEVETEKTDKRPAKRKAGKTTVSIYMRTIQAFFNYAIKNKIVPASISPFGSGSDGYVIPTGKKTKRALNEKQISDLFNYDYTGMPHAQKARDFWFCSYFCQGMNMNDILKLKYENIKGATFTYIRSKTNKSGEAVGEPITVAINSFVSGVIAQYGNPDRQPSNYVFPVLNNSMSKWDIYRAVDNFIRLVNQHLKPVANVLGLPADFSTYYARHSFATTLLRSGKNTEFIQKAIGHASKKTTELYLGSFENDALTEVNDMLLNMVKK